MTYQKSGYPASFVARRPSLAPQQLRQVWVRAISLAQEVAAAAARAGDGDQTPPRAGNGELAQLMVALRDLKHDNFPVPAWSARQMAAAFLTLAQSFVRAEMGPEARTACAPFMAAGAKTLDGLLTADATQAARATWGRQMGERDDD